MLVIVPSLEPFGANFNVMLAFGRYAECAQAVAGRALKEKKPKVVYIGLLRAAEQSDVPPRVGAEAYQHWDASPHAPPKARERETLPMPSLNALTMLQDGSVLVPDAVMNKFAAGTVEHSMLCEKKKQIEEEFRALGHAVAVAGTVAAPNPGGNRAPRARGRPDWTIEGGLKPQHLEKLVLLEVLPGATFNVNRHTVS